MNKIHNYFKQFIHYNLVLAENIWHTPKHTLCYKKMYILYGIIGVAFLGVVFFLGEPIKNDISKLLIPSKFKKYKYLSEGNVTSEHYEIVKLLDHWEGTKKPGKIISTKHILFDLEKKDFLVVAHLKEYNSDDQHVLLRVNKKGELIDSIRFLDHMRLHDSGVYFGETHYIDWITSGIKTKQKYTSVLDGDQLSKLELDNYLSRASTIDISSDYGKKRVRFYLQTPNGWSVISSKEQYEKIEEKPNTDESFSYSVKLKDYTGCTNNNFLMLEDKAQTTSNLTVTDNPLYVEKFVKEYKESRSLMDINNNSRSGWSGVAYLKFRHKSDSLNFKASAFMHKSNKSINTNIFTYRPNENDADLIFIDLTKLISDNRPFERAGLYILKRKKN